jgi:cytochrome P450
VGIDVEVNMSNMHTSPKFWGEDNMQWKPRRWIRKDESGADALVDVAEMTFVGWSYGPRVCPGKKFSQVEYIAVLATILRGYRIAVALGPGETQDQANARLMGVVQDSFHALVVKMRHPEDAGIVLQKR